MKDGKAVAIKVLNGGGESEEREVHTMKELCHVS